MRVLRLVPVLFVLACGQEGPEAPADAPAPGTGALQTEEDKALYALGLSLGDSLAPFSLTEAELEKVTLGLSDKVSGKEPQVELEQYISKVRELAQARMEAAAKGNQEQAEKFLTELAATPGGTRTPSGLVYVETQAGTGASPTASDRVTVHYKGTLPDGKQFDSSIDRGQPATFPLTGVVPCWTEGLQKMKVGGKAKLGCPPGLAYGDDGRPPQIPGGSALLFEVELIGIEGK